MYTSTKTFLDDPIVKDPHKILIVLAGCTANNIFQAAETEYLKNLQDVKRKLPNNRSSAALKNISI